MTKVGTLVNLAAGRGNGKGKALVEMLNNKKVPNVKILNQFSDLEPSLLAMASAQIDELFISSGDGTIQAIVTTIAETKYFHKQPRICILPHGTTNLTAIDLGFKRRQISNQADFIANPEIRNVRVCPTLKVNAPRGESPRHGFSFGAGAAARATRLTQTELNDKGRKGQLAALRMMLGAVAQSLFTKSDPNDQKRIDRPYIINVSIDGKQLCSGDQLMFVATTLEKQFFNTKPFWGGKNGPIRASAIAYPPPNLARWLIPLMYGSENRKMPKGAVSASGSSFNISCNETYVMDGEFFEGPTTGPLLVEAGQTFEFITY